MAIIDVDYNPKLKKMHFILEDFQPYYILKIKPFISLVIIEP